MVGSNEERRRRQQLEIQREVQLKTRENKKERKIQLKKGGEDISSRYKGKFKRRMKKMKISVRETKGKFKCRKKITKIRDTKKRSAEDRRCGHQYEVSST